MRIQAHDHYLLESAWVLPGHLCQTPTPACEGMQEAHLHAALGSGTRGIHAEVPSSTRYTPSPPPLNPAATRTVLRPALQK